ncbi:hypothetical protein EZ313_06060 [Ramlibacter henchirensis]|uniref:Uncharacterized protein n=1 Tax=Ramlibacter henchirensis TaxID=204072 RepID=A0A4Z0C3F6_9BURK|nr:hypothetical protein [Ramlibacter henchirensis]TFZ06207.1 hypothetical protein EZ313_06060 [Ramlibacter henchirensis]
MSRDEHDRPGTADLVAGHHREVPADRAAASTQDSARRPEGQPPQGGMPAQGMPQQRPPQDATTMQQPREQQPPDALHGETARARPEGAMGPGAAEQLAALFPPQVAADFRGRWDQVQIGFVDDPRRAVQQADELVAEVMKSLAASFADQRARLEAGLGHDAQPNTEDLRVALRGYRSFFQRLLSL